MIIRICNESDAQKILEIGEQTFRDTYAHMNDPNQFEQYMTQAFNIEKIKKELDEPYSEFFFLLDKNDICAYIKLNTEGAQTEVMEDAAEVERIYVRKEYKGKGYGMKLIQHAVKWSKERNKSYLWLGVWKKNEAAISFYERMGFEKFGTHHFMVASDAQEDWLMRMELG